MTAEDARSQRGGGGGGGGGDGAHASCLSPLNERLACASCMRVPELSGASRCWVCVPACYLCDC